MKRIILIVFLIASISPVIGQKLKYQKIADGKIQVKIPENFVEMLPDDIAVRFPSVRKPIAAFTGPQRLMSFNIAISATQWNKDDYEIAKEFFRASLLNLFDKVDMINEGVTDIKKNTYIFFEFESTVRGTQTKATERSYNFMMYHIVKGKTIVVSFMCPRMYMEEWKDKANTMMQSIKLSKNI